MNEKAADVVAVWGALVRRGRVKYPGAVPERQPERRATTESEA